MATTKGTLEHLREEHAVKLQLGVIGGLVVGAGSATGMYPVAVVGWLLVLFAGTQLVVYWRHDHESCDHPACAELNGGVPNGDD